MVEISAVKIQDLTYYYPETKKPALNRINLEVPSGQLLVIAGSSGSGKSTLLRSIAGLVPNFFGGTASGTIYLSRPGHPDDGIDIRKMERCDLAQKVGIVFQNPESQLVMMKVEQEIAFGLENLGLPNKLMKRRVMEASSALGLSNNLNSSVPELSGGQKQKTALAAVLAMQPDILLLDEPTSQLDPVAAEEFLAVIRRLNEENGTTIILIEQRLERCFHLADRIVFMDNGQIRGDCQTREIAQNGWLIESAAAFLPPVPRMFADSGWDCLPMSVKEGRKILNSFADSMTGIKVLPKPKNIFNNTKIQPDSLVEINNLWYSYPNGQEVLKNIQMKITAGDFVAIMGDNGAGKTTLLKQICGVLKPGRGQIQVMSRDSKHMTLGEMASQLAYLSQDPNDYLFLPSVREELSFTSKNLGLDYEERVEEILNRFILSAYADSNPRDLSTGERQRVAIASVLVSGPQLLLLDEPTRGLDYQLKANLGQLLLQLQSEGMTIILVTHDVEFAAEYAASVVLMSDGSIIAQGSKYEILQGTAFYSSQVNKLFKNMVNDVVTLDEGREILLQLRKLNKGQAVSI